jgi:hypothetical protein
LSGRRNRRAAGLIVFVAQGSGYFPHPAESFMINQTRWVYSPTAAMTHIAIAEALDGKVVDWLEHVSDAQYGA